MELKTLRTSTYSTTQIQDNINPMDHCFILAMCHHTKLVKIKMLHKCIFKLNGKCVGNQSINDLSNHNGLDVVICFSNLLIITMM
jgi:hypothetical protein